MTAKTVYTSSGIIRNPDKPRSGVTGTHQLQSWIFDEIDQGIDLGFEEYLKELPEEDREEDEYHSDSRTMLFGDAWTKVDGNWTIDKSKTFAAIYNNDSGNVIVEWSKHTTRCHHTSPCYVMSDGSGPCGDLNTPGNAVLAYTLPPEFFEVEQ